MIRRAWLPWLGAVVAGLAVGVGVSHIGRDADFVDFEAGMTARGELAAALDGTPSGAFARTDAMVVAPLYTVVATDGRVCRAFRAKRGPEAYEAAACREGDEWRVIVLATVADPPADFAQGPRAQPVSVMDTIDALRPDKPLSGPAEWALIVGDWRASAD